MQMTVRRGGVLENAWYRGHRWVYLLWPVSLLFALLARWRRHYLQRRQRVLPVPVVVVGNITPGGTGKTPLLMALLQHLQSAGRRPGVVSRGYGGRAPAYPYLVTGESVPAQAGDEPCEIVAQTGAPVCVDPDRRAAARKLVELGCDIILSDDGLQHYRLARDLEIAVVDGQRLFGNGLRLPAGPLREPVQRLAEVDLVVVNQPAATETLAPYRAEPMQLQPQCWRRLDNGEALALSALPSGTRVNALAGIGNPQRFFSTLRQLGLQPVEHGFADHWQYRREDLRFAEPLPLVMTTKDAVKCRAFADALAQPGYYLSVEAQLPASFWSRFDDKIHRIQAEKTTGR